MNSNEQRKLIFNENEYEILSELFHDETGIILNRSRESLIESRLRKRLFELQLVGSDYIRLVSKDASERKRFVDFLTTHKTEWFREPVHFNFLNEWLHTEGTHIAQKRPLMFWSAASSTGEEAYSIVLDILKNNFSPTQFRILGTDISTDCVDKAELGTFPYSGISNQRTCDILRRGFTKSLGPKGERQIQARADVQASIKFRIFNLYADSLPDDLLFDVIFLRNVLIYFSAEKSAAIIQKACKHLRIGGYLVLGLSESLPPDDEFKSFFKNIKSQGSSIYRKINP
ncbi:MAG TPA: CheR family methyltransferase [Pseudobdellovibrionaceae bacterium]